jgi:hypothetical protein
MRIEQVVPWGRSFDEYARMFALTPADLTGRILGCGDGPASFNVELTGRGGSAISCDPIYRFSAERIEARIASTYDTVLAATQERKDWFIWDEIPSIEALGQRRMAAMQRFLADYRTGPRQARYVAAELPALPFVGRAFDLAVCSHLLFLYTEQLSCELHVAAVLELCRVAREVRIFPLLDLEGRPSTHAGPVRRALEEAGWRVAIEKVPYEFQRGANQMMRIWRGSDI